MHLSAEVEQEVLDLLRAKTPKKYQDDHSFLSRLVATSFRSHASAEEVERQLLTELRTYFEADTQETVSALLQEAQRPRKRPAEEDNPQPEKRTKTEGSRLDVSKTNLYLRKSPKELNSIEQINSYFKQFGDILNVQVYPHKNSAQVCFSSEEAATAALASREPVLGQKSIHLAAFRSKKKQTRPADSPGVKVKQVARELTIRKKELSKEKTDLVQSLLKVLNERREELSQEEQKALLEQIRSLGVPE